MNSRNKNLAKRVMHALGAAEASPAETGLGDDVLGQLVEIAAEQRGLDIPTPVTPTARLKRRAADFSVAVQRELVAWGTRHRVYLAPASDGQDLYEAQGPYAVLMTLRGEGVGIWDGRWDAFFRDDTRGTGLKLLQRHLEARLRKWADGTGAGLLEDQLALDAEQLAEAEVEFDDDDEDDDDD